MDHEPINNSIKMPKMVEFFLTNRLPCAFVVVMMLTSVYWFNILFGSIPLLGFLLVLVGMLLHLAVPSLFVLVLFGGGLTYCLQVAGITALSILVLSSGSINAMLIFLGLFVVIPVVTGLTLQRQGLSQASWLLSVALFILMMLVLLLATNTDHSAHGYVTELFKPMFDNMIAAVPAGETAALESIHQLQRVLVDTFPGLCVFSLWLLWWSNVLFARKLAEDYGFYQGDSNTMMTLALPKKVIVVLLVFIALSNMTSGDLQYLAINGLLVLAGLVAVQGVVVAHAWLKSREMLNTIVVMYVMLFFWSAVIVLYMIIGLLDIGFNFRRNMVSATGGK